jgi:hypothetical protein
MANTVCADAELLPRASRGPRGRLARMSHKLARRYRQCEGFEMTEISKAGWGATVQGDERDIARWEGALKKPFDPWVETHDNQMLLRSAAFDELVSARDVRDRAVALIDRLNGAMSLSCDAGPLRFAGVTQFMSDGARHRTMFPESAQINLSGMQPTVMVAGPDGQPLPRSPAPSDVQVWASLAESDDFLDDALIYFGTATEWFDIYKTLETLILRFGPKEKAFLSLLWAPKKDIELLKRTANWARHAKRKSKPPPNPMDLAEARRLLGQLLRRALVEAGAP